MSFVVDKGGLKPGLIIFQRTDAQRRNDSLDEASEALNGEPLTISTAYDKAHVFARG